MKTAKFSFIMTVFAAVFALNILAVLHGFGFTGTGAAWADFILGCALGLVSLIVGALFSISIIFSEWSRK